GRRRARKPARPLDIASHSRRRIPRLGTAPSCRVATGLRDAGADAWRTTLPQRDRLRTRQAGRLLHTQTRHERQSGPCGPRASRAARSGARTPGPTHAPRQAFAGAGTTAGSGRFHQNGGNMRGEFWHKEILARRLRQTAEACGATVQVEVTVRVNDVPHYIDLLFEKGGRRFVAEPEQTSRRVHNDVAK